MNTGIIYIATYRAQVSLVHIHPELILNCYREGLVEDSDENPAA